MVNTVYLSCRNLVGVLTLWGSSLLFVVCFVSVCLAQDKPPSPKLLPATLSFEAKDIPLAQALRQLAEKNRFNFVMAEAPEPGDGTSVQFTNLAFAQGMEKLCKPFDYTYKKGPGNILLFECQYTNLLPMPTLTMGELWAYYQDLEQVAKPYRTARGDGVSRLCRQLLRSLTPAQWKTLGDRAKNQKGLTYAELGFTKELSLR